MTRLVGLHTPSFSHIHLFQVEWVLMRAMSLGLIRGTIDEVEACVEVSWVRPRVLDRDQLGLLSGQLEAWAERLALNCQLVFLLLTFNMFL